MRLRLWGTRGSIAVAGPDTVRYGGDTSAVELECADNRVVILDGGSGIRAIPITCETTERVDILLSHLHMDHVQGLPFFPPLLDPELEVHVWGPVSTTKSLRERLSRYLSPPLFPIRVRDLANVWFHDVVPGTFELGDLRIAADLISHPGSTIGYRIEEGDSSLAYIPDHEPALGNPAFPGSAEWTSGYDLASGVDVLIHDAQYSDETYTNRIGWGHTSVSQLATYANLLGVDRLVTFHHDPWADDAALDVLHEDLANRLEGPRLVPGMTGLTETV